MTYINRPSEELWIISGCKYSSFILTRNKKSIKMRSSASTWYILILIHLTIFPEIPLSMHAYINMYYQKDILNGSKLIPYFPMR